MIEGRSVAAIITARGGSKGLPGKNLLELGGKPLVAWTIEAARGAHTMDTVLLSTDSEEIATVGLAYGAEVPFLRPVELSGDFAKQEDAVLHAMGWLEAQGRRSDLVAMLAPTNPLRTSGDIDAAVEYLVSHERARSVMTVSACTESPIHANVLPPDGSLASFVPEDLRWKNRQELPQYCRVTGAVAVAEWDHFAEHRTFLTPESYALTTAARASVDIDSPRDYLLAQIYLDHPELE